jgi:hypothetical protein
MTPTPTRLAAAALLALSLCASPARAGSPDEHVVLTPALVQKVKAAASDLGNLKPQTAAEEAEDDKHRKNGELPVEYFIQAMESAVDKKSAAEMMGKFTKEQQANIALLRKMGPAAYTLKEAAN